LSLTQTQRNSDSPSEVHTHKKYSFSSLCYSFIIKVVRWRNRQHERKYIHRPLYALIEIARSKIECNMEELPPKCVLILLIEQTFRVGINVILPKNKRPRSSSGRPDPWIGKLYPFVEKCEPLRKVTYIQQK
jgi:hypothetical protein